jgi:anaerobic selenocysteine-containing dehydrogenase
MTNHWIDLKNANVHLIMGSNAVENHPIASYHIWKAKEENNATIIHVDPRYTRTMRLFVRGRISSSSAEWSGG